MATFDKDLIFVHPEIASPPAGKDKITCLKNMVNVLSDRGYLQNIEQVFIRLMKRENDLSTGIGNHIAVPHVRDSHIKAFKAVIYLLDKEIDFNSLDDKGVRLIILFAVPEDEGNSYMHLLAKVSEFLRDTDNRISILRASNKNEIYKKFRRLEYV